MELINLMKGKSISVVGMAKNAGKTVSLNYLIEKTMDEGITIGITSTGRDGERQDIVTMTEKPVIYVPEGSVLATAQELALKSDAKLEILEVTNYHTAIGPVIIARVREGGLVEIAGPDTNTQIKAVADKMQGYGAQIIIVDGAINRKTAASPVITDATILATGAVLSRNMDKVIEETLHQINLFHLEEIPAGEVRDIVAKMIVEKRYGIIKIVYNENLTVEVKTLDMETAINSGKIIGAAIKREENDMQIYIVISGSLLAKTLQDILEVTGKLSNNINFVVADATKIFIPPREWKLLSKRGIKIKVLKRIHTLAVTINPYAPQGYYFDSIDFQRKMQQVLAPLPVIDVYRGGEI